MIYNTPAKGEDGLYFVKVLSDEKRKCLIQLNGVKAVDVSGDVVLDLVSEANTQKIQGVDAQNLPTRHGALHEGGILHHRKVL